MSNIIKFPKEKTKEARQEKAVKDCLKRTRDSLHLWETQEFFKQYGLIDDYTFTFKVEK